MGMKRVSISFSIGDEDSERLRNYFMEGRPGVFSIHPNKGQLLFDPKIDNSSGPAAIYKPKIEVKDLLQG